MAGIPKVKITFDADFDELRKGVKGATDEVQSFSDRAADFGKKAAAAFAVAGAAALAFGAKAVKAAAEDQEAQQKLAQTLRATTTATEAPDRAARRRLNRKGHPVDATRVLYLRGSSTNSRRDGDSRTYSHRWVVDGHWRSQPYGPGRRDRRPVFIAPYIKGPAGAPMLSGEKVIAFMRPDRYDPT